MDNAVQRSYRSNIKSMMIKQYQYLKIKHEYIRLSGCSKMNELNKYCNKNEEHEKI